MQLKNTGTLNLELYTLKTRIRLVLFFKNEPIFAKQYQSVIAIFVSHKTVNIAQP